jgi:hypothetical protein
MESIISSISGVLLLLAGILLLRCQRRAGRSLQSADLSRLKEAERSEESVKRDCLASLDVLQRRLETSQNRAGSVEQMRSGLGEPPQVARKEQFEAAALLLAAGHAAERVAAVLALPISQVELVAQLQKHALKAHCLTVSPQAVPAIIKPPRRGKKKLPTRQARQKVRPILLTEVVRFGGANAAKAGAAAQ